MDFKEFITILSAAGVSSIKIRDYTLTEVKFLMMACRFVIFKLQIVLSVSNFSKPTTIGANEGLPGKVGVYTTGDYSWHGLPSYSLVVCIGIASNVYQNLYLATSHFSTGGQGIGFYMCNPNINSGNFVKIA